MVEEALKLPRPLPNGKLDVLLSVDHFRQAVRSPVTFSRVRYRRGSGLGAQPCLITGVVSNRFTHPKENLQLEVAAFFRGKLVTGGFTYVDKVFPRRLASFEVDFFDQAQCPKRVDHVSVLPNLSEDKLYNP